MDNPQDLNYWKNRRIDDLKKDWHDESDWIDGYWNSRFHPHRMVIIDAIKEFGDINSVFEIGCNCAPNLSLIKDLFFGVRIGGIDINNDAILKAKDNLPDGEFLIGNIEEIPINNDSYDIILADACLMYVPQEKIEKVINEMARIAKKGIVICDWFSDKEEIKDYHWVRDYKQLFEDKGFKIVFKKKIDENIWQSKNWQNNGIVIALVRQ